MAASAAVRLPQLRMVAMFDQSRRASSMAPVRDGKLLDGSVSCLFHHTAAIKIHFFRDVKNSKDGNNM